MDRRNFYESVIIGLTVFLFAIIVFATAQMHTIYMQKTMANFENTREHIEEAIVGATPTPTVTPTPCSEFSGEPFPFMPIPCTPYMEWEEIPEEYIYEGDILYATQDVYIIPSGG